MSELIGALEQECQSTRDLLAIAGEPITDPSLRAVLDNHVELLSQARNLLGNLVTFQPSYGPSQPDPAGLEQERVRLRAFSEVGTVVNSSLDLPRVLDLVMDKAIEITGAERGYLVLRQPSGEMEFTVARNLSRGQLDQRSLEISRTIVNRVAATGQPVLTTNAQVDPRFQGQQSVVSYSLRSILCVPLQTKDKVIGVMYVDNRIKSGLFGDQELDLMAAFASQAAAAIDNARLFERVNNAYKLMDSIFGSITSGVITTDIADRISLFNRAAERILGVRREECEGTTWPDALAPFHLAVAPLLDDVKHKQRPITDYEAEAALPGRGKVNLSVSLSPLRDANDDIQGTTIVINDVTERKRFERERSMVGRYLPRELIESLADLQELRLGGTRGMVTILFADLRGFTSYSEVHAPEQVVELINRYYAVVSKLIRRNDGIVDKYEGDAVMAHFGTPLHPIQDHAWRAVLTAWQTQQAIRAYHRIVPPEDRLSFGIGVNTGEAVAGNIGGEEQMDYTLIGDAVNLARRLQENADPDQTLIGEHTFQMVKDRVSANVLPLFLVRGRKAHARAYEVVGLNKTYT